MVATPFRSGGKDLLVETATEEWQTFFCLFKPLHGTAAKVKFNIPTETDIYVLDDTGTEVDEEVFSDILEEKTDILWMIVDVLSLVKRVLEQKPGGEKIFKEYAMKGEMKDRTRRDLVNIIVADMVEKYG
ncbi:uncharacterized protein AKAME5_001445600 [Lates japonicus]|uniref:Uncharacterized protein n=1 Tax=Lates japonicus TaxID=270547 RepID=A0AAD3RCD0_LATJO|nr:uncharacterized protein AKAME5_001445600 [Lates japonicus]